jgi:hypothetical protein
MRALYAAAISIWTLALPLVAQVSTATLTGKVKDITGAGVHGTVAELQLERAPINPFQTVSDATGVFHFAALPAGEYTLRLSTGGFQRLTIKAIQILDGEQKSIPVLELVLGNMNCAGGAVSDHIRFLPPGDNVGSLGGTVRLDEGPLVGKSMVIAGVDVTLTCSTGKTCGAVKTDSQGEFLFTDLPPGDFSVRVTAPGFYRTEGSPAYKVLGGIESVYTSIYIERCYLGNCDPKLRPKKPPGLCM